MLEIVQSLDNKIIVEDKNQIKSEKFDKRKEDVTIQANNKGDTKEADELLDMLKEKEKMTTRIDIENIEITILLPLPGLLLAVRVKVHSVQERHQRKTKNTGKKAVTNLITDREIIESD